MEAVVKVLGKPSSQSSGVDKAIADFAVGKFPRISPELIRRNYNELAYAMEVEQCCHVCMSLDMCEELLNTHGFQPVLKLQSDGWMDVEYTPCRYSTFRVKARGKVLPFAKKEESEKSQSRIDFGTFGSEV